MSGTLGEELLLPHAALAKRFPDWKPEELFIEPTAAAQLLSSVGSSQGNSWAARTQAAVSKEGAGFSPGNTFSWDAALTIEKPQREHQDFAAHSDRIQICPVIFHFHSTVS